MAPILVYWNLRGRATPIRMLLHHVNERFIDKHYSLDNLEEWYEDKKDLRDTLDFPNLPYYIDGKVQISETKAILSYLGRKFKLDGTTEAERVRIDLANAYFDDIMHALVGIAYPAFNVNNREEIHEVLKNEYEKNLPHKFDEIARFLKENEWVAGDKVTSVDFYVYDILDFNRILFDPKYLEVEPTLSAYMKRFEELSGVKEFLAPDAFDRLPIFSQFAMFGHSKEYKYTPKIT